MLLGVAEIFPDVEEAEGLLLADADPVLAIGLYSANETLVVVTCTKALPISALGLLS